MSEQEIKDYGPETFGTEKLFEKLRVKQAPKQQPVFHIPVDAVSIAGNIVRGQMIQFHRQVESVEIPCRCG